MPLSSPTRMIARCPAEIRLSRLGKLGVKDMGAGAFPSGFATDGRGFVDADGNRDVVRKVKLRAGGERDGEIVVGSGMVEDGDCEAPLFTAENMSNLVGQ